MPENGRGVPKPPPYTIEELTDKVDELESQMHILSVSNDALIHVLTAAFRCFDPSNVIPAKALLIYLIETSCKIEDPTCAMAVKTIAQQVLFQLQLFDVHDRGKNT